MTTTRGIFLPGLTSVLYMLIHKPLLLDKLRGLAETPAAASTGDGPAVEAAMA